MAKKEKIKKIIKILLFSGIFIIVIFAALVGFYLFYSPSIPKNYDFNRGENGAWVSHKWFSTEKSDAQVEELSKKLQNLQIDRVYIHVGPLNAKGEIPPFDRDIWLKNRERILAKNPRLKIFAWLGGINQTRFGIADDSLNMDNEKVMKNIALLAGKICDSCSFDGIHYDIEPTPDNDEGFIKLLKFTRDNIKNREISVASPSIIVSNSLVYWLNGVSGKTVALWGPAYYRRVAENCDEIAVMTYDSASFTTATYKKYMVYQIKNITRAVKGTECRLLIGVPTYDDKTIPHNPRVENLQTALEGVVLGISSLKDRERVRGVAIYALWTTDEKEIKKYKDLWPYSQGQRNEEKE